MSSRYTVLIFVFILSCSSSSEEAATFGDLFLEGVEEQQIKERVWEDISVNKIFELPVDKKIILYDPKYIRPDTNGDVYVVDYGTYEILRFDYEGNYISSYGDGVGNGPGEFLSITGVRVVSDSIIYVVDPNARRISSFSKTHGNFIGSRSFEDQNPPYRYVMTDTGIEYIFRSQNKVLFESNFRGNTVEFGDLVETQDRYATMVADGLIETYKDWMIYVPLHFPVIMVYDVNGALVRAKKTMSFDRFEEPQLVQFEMNGIVSHRLEGEVINGITSVVGDELYLQARGASRDLIVDVYEAGSVEYKYSFRISSDFKPSFIMNERIYQIIGDTTVVVSSINRSS